MDATMQDTLFFFGRHQGVYPLYACFQEKLLSGFPKAGSKCKNPKSHFTIGICMPASLS